MPPRAAMGRGSSRRPLPTRPVLVPVSLIELAARPPRERSGLDLAPRALQQRQIMTEVMQRKEPRPQRLAAFEQVMKIRAPEPRARRAIARLVERSIFRRV